MKFGNFFFKLLFPKRVKEVEMLRASIEEAQKQLLEKRMKIQALETELQLLKIQLTSTQARLQGFIECPQFSYQKNEVFPTDGKSAIMDFFRENLLKEKSAAIPEFLSNLEKNKLHGTAVSGANSFGPLPGIKMRKGPDKSVGETGLSNYATARVLLDISEEMAKSGIFEIVPVAIDDQLKASHTGQNFAADQVYMGESAGKFGGAGGNATWTENPDGTQGYITFKAPSQVELEMLGTAAYSASLHSANELNRHNAVSIEGDSVSQPSSIVDEVNEIPDSVTVVDDTPIIEMVKTEIARDPEPSIDFDSGSSSSDSYSGTSD